MPIGVIENEENIPHPVAEDTNLEGEMRTEATTGEAGGEEQGSEMRM